MFWNRKKKSTELMATSPQPRQKRERLSEDAILDAFDMLGITAKLDEPQKKLFLAVAYQMQLNPLKREIHAVSIWDSDLKRKVLIPVVGYEVYIKRAEESGRMEYWRPDGSGSIDQDHWDRSDYQASVIIKRKDQPCEFRWTCRYAECVATVKENGQIFPNSMWRKRPYFMTQKCAIGQGFRLAFPDVLLDMPYVDAEIDGQEAPEDEHPKTAEPQAIAGIVVDAQGLVVAGDAEEVARKEAEREAEELKAARGALQAVYATLKRPVGTDEVILYTKKEMDAKVAEGKAAGADVEKLRALAIAWSEEFTERGASYAFNQEKEKA